MYGLFGRCVLGWSISWKVVTHTFFRFVIVTMHDPDQWSDLVEPFRMGGQPPYFPLAGQIHLFTSFVGTYLMVLSSSAVLWRFLAMRSKGIPSCDKVRGVSSTYPWQRRQRNLGNFYTPMYTSSQLCHQLGRNTFTPTPRTVF